MTIKSNTWLLKNTDQYDYTSSYVKSAELHLSSSVTLYRLGNDIIALPLSGLKEEVPATAVPLVNILVHRESVLLVSCALNQGYTKLDSQTVWLVVQKLRHGRHRGYVLNEGDVIRLGNRKWLVTEVNIPENHSVEKCLRWDRFIRAEDLSQGVAEDPQANYIHVPGISTDRQSTIDPICKVCLSDEITEDNPLIAPCKCIGSVKYIHLRCLESWFSCQRRELEWTHSKQFAWKVAPCCVCNTKLPMDLFVEGKLFRNIGVPKPERSAFLALKDLDKQTSSTQIEMWQWNEQQSIVVGHRSGSQVSIEDPSISPEHARLVIEDGEVLLQDCESVYGTTVLVQKPIVLAVDMDVTVQCGNTVLTFTMERTVRKCFQYFSRNRQSKPVSDHEYAEELRLMTGMPTSSSSKSEGSPVIFTSS